MNFLSCTKNGVFFYKFVVQLKQIFGPSYFVRALLSNLISSQYLTSIVDQNIDFVLGVNESLCAISDGF